MAVKKKSIKKAKTKQLTVNTGSTKVIDKNSHLGVCPPCPSRVPTVTMFILIMLGLLGCFYYFQQILENNSKDIGIQSNCGQLNKMVLELNTKITALNTETKTQADKGLEAKANAEMNLAVDKLAIVKTAHKIKKLIDSSADFSKEEERLKVYLKSSFAEEQATLSSQKARTLVNDQELVSTLTKNMNLPEAANHAEANVADKLKHSVQHVVKVKKVEEKIKEQSFSNNVNMAIVKILSHEYAEAAKYIEFTSNKPESFKTVQETLKAKALAKGALDKIIEKTLQD